MDFNGEVSEEEDDNVFYFESDHLALRGNRDYMKLIRTIAVLECQRSRAYKDLENLMEARKRYLKDPEAFVQKLEANEPIVEPHYFTTIPLPEITGYDLMPPKEVKVEESPAQTNGNGTEENKTETINRQLWSCEEQRRLEELLVEYPPEPIESRRFAKIAKALGNRTTLQVSSRVQKYFQKLYMAGMPIPGRIPKNRRIGVSKTRNMYRPSTFFPAHMVPVQIPEDDDMSFADLNNTATGNGALTPHGVDSDVMSSHSGDTKMPPASMRPEAREQMISMLLEIRKEKQSMLDGYQPDPMAQRCEECEVEAVSRCGWYCKTCRCFLNYCADCLTGRWVQNCFQHAGHLVEATETPDM